MKKFVLFSVMALWLAAGGCIKLKHEMTIQPVHVTVDVNIKIDRELENFFGEIDKAGTAATDSGKKQEGSK